MLKTSLDSNAIKGFNRAFRQGHQESLNSAGKAVGFWMRLEMVKALQKSEGVPPVAPLTKRTRAGNRNRALLLIARTVAYDVKRYGRKGLQIMVGPALPNRRAISRYLIENVFGGKRWTMTRIQQRQIAKKIQKRGAALKGGPRYTAGRGKGAHSVLPPVGRQMVLPPRPVINHFALRILPQARDNLSKLYGKAQRGQRWALDWYRDGPPRR